MQKNKQIIRISKAEEKKDKENKEKEQKDEEKKEEANKKTTNIYRRLRRRGIFVKRTLVNKQFPEASPPGIDCTKINKHSNQ